MIRMKMTVKNKGNIEYFNAGFQKSFHRPDSGIKKQDVVTCSHEHGTRTSFE
jgi:hypothetical protein